MEYLMTYGWAILIIAVVMVALFSLGILGGSPLSTTCIAQSGYTCSSPLLHTSQFSAVVGQASGTSWTAVNILFVPQGAGIPPVSGIGSMCRNIQFSKQHIRHHRHRARLSYNRCRSRLHNP